MNIESLKAELEKLPIEYVDSFCVGWNRNRIGDRLVDVRDQQDRNWAFQKKMKRPEQCETGLVDGWKERQERKETK